MVDFFITSMHTRLYKVPAKVYNNTLDGRISTPFDACMQIPLYPSQRLGVGGDGRRHLFSNINIHEGAWVLGCQ